MINLYQIKSGEAKHQPKSQHVATREVNFYKLKCEYLQKQLDLNTYIHSLAKLIPDFSSKVVKNNKNNANENVDNVTDESESDIDSNDELNDSELNVEDENFTVESGDSGLNSNSNDFFEYEN